MGSLRAGKSTDSENDDSSNNNNNNNNNNSNVSNRGETLTKLKPCPVLAASDNEDSVVSFDTACVAYPVVIPPWKSNCTMWKMFYYGRGKTWKNTQGPPPLLPSGWVGLAESSDGVHWTKILGMEENGSILAPSNDPEDFDSVQLGHGDVVIVSDDCWYMYYFGANQESVTMGSSEVEGFRMRIGRAVSGDQGRTWEKLGMVLDYDPSEGWFASWPRVIPSDTEPWQMIYHAFNGVNWRVYGAYSTDHGETWTRQGLLLSGSEDDATSWDYKGIGTRSVTRHGDGWLMVFEAVDDTRTHRIGTAVAPHLTGPWEKAVKPILEPGKAPLPEWTNLVIGTPYILSPRQGEKKPLWLYFVGIGKATDDNKLSIGLVVSESGKVGHDQWSLVSSSLLE